MFVLVVVDYRSHLCLLWLLALTEQSIKWIQISSCLSGNSITPGTKFMLDLTLSLMSWASSRLSSHKYGHLQIEVSDATVKVCRVHE